MSLASPATYSLNLALLTIAPSVGAGAFFSLAFPVSEDPQGLTGKETGKLPRHRLVVEEATDGPATGADHANDGDIVLRVDACPLVRSIMWERKGSLSAAMSRPVEVP